MPGKLLETFKNGHNDGVKIAIVGGGLVIFFSNIFSVHCMFVCAFVFLQLAKILVL